VVGDYAILEIIAEQLEEVGKAASPQLALRYAAARITLNNSSDVVEVVCVRWGPKFPQKDLSANLIH
jgi:hypothetical protein